MHEEFNGLYQEKLLCSTSRFLVLDSGQCNSSLSREKGTAGNVSFLIDHITENKNKCRPSLFPLGVFWEADSFHHTTQQSLFSVTKFPISQAPALKNKGFRPDIYTNHM